MRKLTPIHYETLIKIFECEGFVVQRKKGDHVIMIKPGIKRPLVTHIYQLYKRYSWYTAILSFFC